jgi:hypothetical protein
MLKRMRPPPSLRGVERRSNPKIKKSIHRNLNIKKYNFTPNLIYFMFF